MIDYIIVRICSDFVVALKKKNTIPRFMGVGWVAALTLTFTEYVSVLLKLQQ